ncbi:MAG: hypothetical protein ACLRXA_24655 [Clostridium sp.]
MGYHTSGIYVAFRNQGQDFITGAGIHAAGFKGQFFPYIAGSGRLCASSYNATM